MRGFLAAKMENADALETSEQEWRHEHDHSPHSQGEDEDGIDRFVDRIVEEENDNARSRCLARGDERRRGEEYVKYTCNQAAEQHKRKATICSSMDACLRQRVASCR